MLRAPSGGTEPLVQRGERAAAPSNASDGIALRDYGAAELDAALAHLAWRGGRLHEGVHQARKSLRRARAVLALGMPALGPGAELLAREFGRLNRRLSKLRDAQALVEVLDRLIGKTDEAEFASVLRRARRIAASARAARAREMLTADPGLADRRALLTTLRAAFPALSWNTLTEEAVRKALTRSEVRVEQARVRALADGKDTDWHRWRRRVRRLSQQHRALGEMVAEMTKVKDDCKAIAVLLGDAQDYALLRERTGKRSLFTDDDRRVLRLLADRGSERIRARVQQKTQPLVATTAP